MGGRFSPMGEGTPERNKDGTPMELGSPSPPQRQLRNKRRLIREESLEPLPKDSAEPPSQVGNWPQKRGEGWSNGEESGRGERVPP